MLRPTLSPGGPRTPPAPWEWRDPAPAWMGLCLAAARRYVNAAGDSLAARAAALFDSLGPGLRGDLHIGVAFRTLRLKGDPRLCPYPEAGSSTVGGAEDGRTRLYGWRLFGIFPLGLEEGGHAIRRNPHDCQREKRVVLGRVQRWLVGKHGLPEVAQLSAEGKAANAKVLPNWKVQDGILYYDGKSNSLQTVKNYGDIELYVDWKIEPRRLSVRLIFVAFEILPLCATAKPLSASSANNG